MHIETDLPPTAIGPEHPARRIQGTLLCNGLDPAAGILTNYSPHPHKAPKLGMPVGQLPSGLVLLFPQFYSQIVTKQSL